MPVQSVETTTRPPAVAGTFYARNAERLRRDVDALLTNDSAPLRPAPKALIVPHAGYIYSGPIAATAYRQLLSIRSAISKVVLIGPAHREYVRGIALPRVNAFETPLGPVPIDLYARAVLAALPQVSVRDSPHELEHSLEVQLPFLQSVLDEFALLPMLVGDATPAEVADVLDKVWGGDETLILISSDLSHFLTYEQARSRDATTVRKILNSDQGLNHDEACGATPINGLLQSLTAHELKPELLALKNSGDTAGDRQRVVGYCAIAYRTPHAHRGAILLKLAREAIARSLGLEASAEFNDPWLTEPGATFVTLRRSDRLRGCIGSLEARRALQRDLEDNAVASALRDPRFPPVTADELSLIKVEVSELSNSKPIEFDSEADLLNQLRPGVDGVIFESHGHRATFLPQVWEDLPDSRQFMAHLKQKAGLSPAFWADEVRIQRYTVDKWSEE
jgi:AmmeMemoRadiSam system protein B/AmmeMemoRadiSam system protein A